MPRRASAGPTSGTWTTSDTLRGGIRIGRASTQGAISAIRLTASGRRAARIIATWVPSEWPTTPTGASEETRGSSAPARDSGPVRVRARRGLAPNPGRLTATARAPPRRARPAAGPSPP